MPIQQSKKQDDLEKRLRILHSQVYGKSSPVFSHLTNTGEKPSASSITDIAFLRKDLIKTSVLATIALASQVLLFVLLQQNIIRLGF